MNLQDYIDQSQTDTATYVEQVSQANMVVEPLDGPTDLSDVYDSFPETIYNQGRDTHLYAFLTALCGDAGAGLIKRQAYLLRLKETGVLTFHDLDTFYTEQFRFRRLANELYDFDPDTALTQDQWDEIAQKDDSFKHRVQNFMRATQIGNSPEGLALAATAGSGVDCEILENYKGIFDAFSDDIRGLSLPGYTTSTNEFVVNPRLIDAAGNLDTSAAYSPTVNKTYNQTITGAPPYINVPTWQTTSPVDPIMLPNLEWNMIDTLDRLRPVGSLMSVKLDVQRYQPITIPDANVAASSERFFMIRFVTGSANVNWPVINPDNGTFIESNIENESVTTSFFIGRDFPTIFQTIQRISAYDLRALDDPTYGTIDFFSDATGIPPYYLYQSIHTGTFHQIISSIYPFLKAYNDQFFPPEFAIANQDTQYTFRGVT